MRWRFNSKPGDTRSSSLPCSIRLCRGRFCRRGSLPGEAGDVFSGALADRRGQVAGSLVTAATKLLNYAIYQFKLRAVEFTTNLQFRMLRAAIDSGRPLPWYIRGLPVKQVYIRAMREYEPIGTVKATVILFPATEGEGDNEPNAVRFCDLRIGWDRWISSGLEICRAPGGHISMLHEPNVAIVAERICALMQHEPATTEAKT